MMSVWKRRAGPDPPLDSVLCEGQRKTSQVWKLQGEGVEHPPHLHSDAAVHQREQLESNMEAGSQLGSSRLPGYRWR